MKVEKVMIVRHLMRLGAFMEREGSRALIPTNLTHQQFLVLSRISEQGSLSQKDLCDKMLYEKSNVSRIIKRLHSLGLVQIEPDSEDARRQVINTTDKGRLTIAQGKGIISDSVERWFSKLTDSESTEILSKLIWLNTMMR
ncbi:MAG: MarR family transcriptional regulator [Thermodesulfovibrionales bacterium]|nr:MarR family transcriptional regulator [Thermodesulfovibrionales bacterium]